jgi:hypothetical protein
MGKRATRRSYAYAVADADLIRPLHDMVVPIVSIPELDRPAWYWSWHRLAGDPTADWWSGYPKGPMIGCALKIAHFTWDKFPPQTAGAFPFARDGAAPGPGHRGGTGGDLFVGQPVPRPAPIANAPNARHGARWPGKGGG